MIDAIGGGALPAAPVAQERDPPKASARGAFAGELATAQASIGEMRFSAHAQKRLLDRNIHLSESDRARITESTNLAAAKGSRETLVLMDRLALVVSVPSRTVITVMEPHAGDPSVFTNIDSVVVVPNSGA